MPRSPLFAPKAHSVSPESNSYCDMAELRINGSKKKTPGIVKLKNVAEKLQRSLLSARKAASDFFDDSEDICDSTNVPEDVKEGHFAVIAADKNELRRFIVPLSYLSHPSFLRLLEEAAEQFGFDHEGAVTVPCRPSELERMLSEHGGLATAGLGWGSRSSKTLLNSY
ncbi:auxin-responsive protein SAUR50-like [Diospyros lotus]|uniref:auxin-responsive protein SAUR50-like n=1 Tax=Diospyros lotus TaxID=55363 RepID=UPI0022509574|nr:auxin-responsive protein SAUR50-like [Diospyros lotus]